jgi:hypothetical protein
MPATVSWYQQGRIIFTELEGNLLKAEMDSANQMMAQYVGEGQPPVHILVDALRLEKFPLDLKQFSGAKLYMQHPNVGKLALISKQSVFVKFFASVITQAAHIEMQMFDTLEAGFDFLKRIDMTLKIDDSANK